MVSNSSRPLPGLVAANTPLSLRNSRENVSCRYCCDLPVPPTRPPHYLESLSVSKNSSRGSVISQHGPLASVLASVRAPPLTSQHVLSLLLSDGRDITAREGNATRVPPPRQHLELLELLSRLVGVRHRPVVPVPQRLRVLQRWPLGVGAVVVVLAETSLRHGHLVLDVRPRRLLRAVTNYVGALVRRVVRRRRRRRRRRGRLFGLLPAPLD